MPRQFDKEAAARHAVAAASPEPDGHCARFVREAIEAGGIVLTRTAFAKDYGSHLRDGGFESILTTPTGHAPSDYHPEIGDVVIFQAAHGHPAGHMQMFTHRGFVSDFIQHDPFWPSSSQTSVWKTEKPSTEVFRFPSNGSVATGDSGDENSIAIGGDFLVKGPVEDNVTFCPVTRWAEAMSFRMDLDKAARSVSFDGERLATPVTIRDDGEAYAPIRALAEAAGLTVSFNPATRTVNVTRP